MRDRRAQRRHGARMRWRIPATGQPGEAAAVRWFQSTRPVWAATTSPENPLGSSSSFNPRGPCGPRLSTRGGRSRPRSFNPRGPCGPRQRDPINARHRKKFQSTRPVWAATSGSSTRSRSSSRFQSTRPVWAATRRRDRRRTPSRVSIHAARVGRDPTRASISRARTRFNPRGPCGPRRSLGAASIEQFGVSIHAARVGRDVGSDQHFAGLVAFQSTRPVWAATPRRTTDNAHRKFQSTRPVWAATDGSRRQAGEMRVSIHAARVGRDRRRRGRRGRDGCFNPRGPCGPRPSGPRCFSSAARFNPRGPCGPRP